MLRDRHVVGPGRVADDDVPGDGRSCSVYTYDSNGSQKSKIDTDSKADAISVYKDKIALLDGNTA
ncbi:hypothetical protein, partial [Bilophila wadsworthia]|uniref:hypothetical protein n=1 Tax=Bilophila wadsworthia TaxID=35833 RepID=UPI003AB6423E